MQNDDSSVFLWKEVNDSTTLHYCSRIYVCIHQRHPDNEIYPDLLQARNRRRPLTVDRCVSAAAAVADDDDDGENDAVDMATSQYSARITDATHQCDLRQR